jgi:hypothetical protein
MELLANGWTHEQILKDYPHLTEKHIQAALHYPMTPEVDAVYALAERRCAYWQSQLAFFRWEGGSAYQCPQR